jgi:hypothetical protein
MVESRLAQVSCSRKLYADDPGAIGDSKKTTSKSHSGKMNQISVPLRIRLQSSCVEMLCGRTDELLSLGRSLFDSAQKLRTMGLDKHKLMLVLVEICNLAQVIVILLPQLLSSSAPTSSSPKADYSLLAVDVERVMTLADSALASLLEFLAANVPLLTTHPQLLHQLLQRLYTLAGSWAASRSPLSKKTTTTTTTTTTESAGEGGAAAQRTSGRKRSTQKKEPGGLSASFSASLEGGAVAGSDPLERYQQLLQPLTTFLISYLQDYCATVQKQTKENQVR